MGSPSRRSLSRILLMRLKILGFVLLQGYLLIWGGMPVPVSAAQTKATWDKAAFGSTLEGQAVELYTLKNGNGSQAKVMTYGCIIYSLETPDKNGHLENV